MSALELPQIGATSPSLAELMRVCLLRAGLSRITNGSEFVLGNPKGWLGTAYHEVLRKIVEIGLTQEARDAAVDRLWNQAIATQQERACAHVLDRRFGPAETWPGYYVARSSVTLRAQELCAGLVSPAARAPKDFPSASAGSSIRETELRAYGGKLVGRPDVIRAGEIVDYKTGAILEYNEAVETEVVKAAYVRQLRIYGFLVRETLGWWPPRGVLLPLAGAGVQVVLEPDECVREAMEAVALLDVYNGKLLAGATPEELAAPLPANCRFCPYKLTCLPFWHTVSSVWSGQIDGVAIEGPLASAPGVIYGGAARTISLDIQAGSEIPRRAQIGPLSPLVHDVVNTLAAGDRVRLIGLRARADHVLAPTQRTVLARESDLPAVTVRGARVH